MGSRRAAAHPHARRLTPLVPLSFPSDAAQLASPVWHVGFLGEVYKLIQCVCISCSRILADKVRARCPADCVGIFTRSVSSG